MTRCRRVGVLTGGGDCPGLNAAIRAVVKTTLAREGTEAVGILDGYVGLVEGLTRPLSDSDVSGILPSSGTILGTSNRGNPFLYPTSGPDGALVLSDRSAGAFQHVQQLKLDGLIVIGGDGTLSIAKQFAELGVKLVGVPKTIDNDLGATDVTIGFDSALAIATDAVDRLHATAESHHRVMVLEVMGRYAGWIALRAGIAGGGDVILIPEIPYDMKQVYRAIRRRLDRGKRFSLVVVAEGAHPIDAEPVVQRTVPGSTDPIRLGGVGQVIADHIEQETGLEARVTVLGHLQRGGMPTAFDRWLATRLGVAAVNLLLEGKVGRMVCLKGETVHTVELGEAIRTLKRVDPNGQEVFTARAVGTSFGNTPS